MHFIFIKGSVEQINIYLKGGDVMVGYSQEVAH